MSIFRDIKAVVTARQAAELYGLKVGRNGMVCCPFHNDKHPSLKVDVGFYCFGCGEKGDVIHFVEKLFGLTPYEAASKLAEDFNILITNTKQTGRKQQERKVMERSPYQTVRVFDEWVRYCIRILSEYLHLQEDLKEQYAPTDCEQEWHEKYCEACNLIPVMNHYLDILLCEDADRKIAFLAQKGKEVKEIERKLEEHKRNVAQSNGGSSEDDGTKS